jgi:hypothetical protein
VDCLFVRNDFTCLKLRCASGGFLELLGFGLKVEVV